MRQDGMSRQNAAANSTRRPAGIPRAVARLFSDRHQGQMRSIVTHVLSVLVIGGSMGLLGDSLAGIAHHPLLSNILSGALGASGAFGFEFLVRLTSPLQPS